MTSISKGAYFFVFASLCLAAPARAGVTLLDKDDWKFVVSGFVELDMFLDSTRSLVEGVGSNPMSQLGTATGAGDNGRTQFSLRNSRFAFSILPPEKDGWKTKGYLEFDLLGFDSTPPTVSEAAYLTNPTLRVRHAYLSSESSGLQVLAGQAWTLFGWVPNYVVTTASVPPVTASAYERTPQLTLIKTTEMGEHKIQGAVSVSRPAQRDSEIPNLDAGLRWSCLGRKSGFASPSGDVKAEPLSLAVSGTFRQFVVQTPGGALSDKTHYPGAAIAMNAALPILAMADDKDVGNSLTLMAEATTGKGYSDEFPGYGGGVPQATAAGAAPLNLDAGQGAVDASGSFQLVHLQTWNAQLQYHFPSSWNLFTTWGYGELFSNNIGNLAGTKIYDRTSVYFGNLFHDCTKQIRIAVEADHFTSHYIDGSNGNDNRLQFSAWFRF